jgi:hypothetical protein
MIHISGTKDGTLLPIASCDEKNSNLQLEYRNHKGRTAFRIGRKENGLSERPTGMS